MECFNPCCIGLAIAATQREARERAEALVSILVVLD